MKPIFKSVVARPGVLRLTVFGENGASTSVEVPAEAAPLLACKMLTDAQKATGAPSDTVELAGLPVLNPSGLGLSSPDPRFPTALIVHMGSTRFGVAISTPQKLGEGMLAASAQGQKN